MKIKKTDFKPAITVPEQVPPSANTWDTDRAMKTGLGTFACGDDFVRSEP